MQMWISHELDSTDLGDRRLDERFRILLDRMSAKPSLKFPAACAGGAETQAAYRFVDNQRVDDQKILSPHYDATLRRIQEQPVVILPQDTTEIDLTRKHERMAGAGPLDDGHRIGLLDHTILALTPDRLVLGVVAAQIWAREEDSPSLQTMTRAQRQAEPIEEKESFRWLEGYRTACRVARESPETRVICVSDSEGDIYECYNEQSTQTGLGRTAEWIVRACRDRGLSAEPALADAEASQSPTETAESHLWGTAAATPVLQRLMVKVSGREARSGDGQKRKKGRSQRTAEVTVRATHVRLRAPYRKGMKLDDLAVNAVLVREEPPPEGEEPIEWLLLTSLPIDAIDYIIQVIEYYCCRWQVEIYFKVLKSGCKIEDSQLETAGRFRVYLALQMIVAWRVLFTMTLGRECPELPCDIAFDDDEWRAVYAVTKKEPPPSTPPSLGEMVILVAILGGYQGRKLDGPPGPKAMWVGLQRMMDLGLGWRAFKEQCPTSAGGLGEQGSDRPSGAVEHGRAPPSRDVYND
jgi:hypothetical protein